LRVCVGRFRKALKRQEDICQHDFRNTWSMITDSKYCSSVAIAVDLLERNFDGCAVARITDCVAHDVLNRAAQHLRETRHCASISANNFYLTAVRACFKVAVRRDFLNEVSQIKSLSLRQLSSALDSRQRQQLSNHLV